MLAASPAMASVKWLPKAASQGAPMSRGSVMSMMPHPATAVMKVLLSFPPSPNVTTESLLLRASNWGETPGYWLDVRLETWAAAQLTSVRLRPRAWAVRWGQLRADWRQSRDAVLDV